MSQSKILEPAMVRGGARADIVNIAPFQLARTLGVMRHSTDSYSVGSFRYTNLEDAIAQARRMTKLESELI